MKRQINQQISKRMEDLFLDINSRDSDLVNHKKIKEIIEITKRANFPLREKRKLFCKKCLSYFFIGKNCKIKIKSKIKSIECLNCNYISRYRLKIK